MDYGDIAKYIVENFGWIVLVMTVLVCGLMELVKWPVKKLTAKIQNERIRKLANKSIILLSFGLAFLLEYVAHAIIPQYVSFSSAAALAEGAFANVLYLLGEGVITPEKAKAVVTQIKPIDSEASEDQSKKSAVDEFNDLVKK
jgi:hypothetical protein